MYNHAANRNEQKRGRGPSWPTHFWWPDGGRPTIPSRFGRERQCSPRWTGTWRVAPTRSRPGSWGAPVLLCGCVARSLPRLAWP